MSRKRVKATKIAAKAAPAAPVASNGKDSPGLRGLVPAGLSDPSLGKPPKKALELRVVEVTGQEGAEAEKRLLDGLLDAHRDRDAGGTR